MDIEDWDRYRGNKEPKHGEPNDDVDERVGRRIDQIKRELGEHPDETIDDLSRAEQEELGELPEAPPQGRDGRADWEAFDGDDPKEGDPGASGDDSGAIEEPDSLLEAIRRQLPNPFALGPGGQVEHGPEPWEGDSDPATEPEPRPQGEGFDVPRLVQEDLERRAEMGEEKYGERLTTRNGRDPLVDLYQELLDAACYIRQELQERGQGWTNNPPEEPGHYWMQKRHPETGDPHRKELVLVREYRGALRTHSDPKALPVGRINARWSSRIPEPDERGRNSRRRGI